ncbi:MAG: acetate--CoA ligase family protein [Anaerolineales bacterium]|nr:acetate--CoA ligase family protein [Anaerolineales bacterium]
MTSDYLSLFFRPKGVAIVGASRDPVKLGYGVVRNLVEHHYDGPIYPINPSADEILGQRVYPSIAEVPDPLDLAVIVVPAKMVARELDACGQRGVKAAIVVSGGFREVGHDGAEREEEIKAIAAHYGMALLGPNCIGTIDTHTPLNTTFVTGQPRPGEIALLSQSGAVAAAVIDWARGSGVGFSRIVSLGNQAGVNEADMLGAIANDAQTQVVTAYIEGVSDGPAFLQVATQVARQTPIVALKVGRSSSGAKAVASHTGALAGAEAAYDAAFRRAGVLRASRLEEMLDWARALAWQPLPKGNRVAVLTNAGGPGVMAVDALEAAGMQLAPLTEATKAFLRQRVPPAASIENPVDILAGSGPATYALCLDALLADETVDAVVVMTAPQDWFAPLSLAEVVGEVSASPLGRRKPVLSVIMGLASTSDATQVLHRRRTPNFAFPERVASTLAAMWQRKQWLDALPDTPTVMSASSVEPHPSLEGMTGWLPPHLIDDLLQAYAIPIPKAALVNYPDEAATAATTIGYPVALKLIAEGLTHKSDVGGVKLHLMTPEAVHEAATTMLNQVEDGALYVQQMVKSEVEAIIGVVRDPQFGALVMVGTGGTFVELLADTAFELAPVTPAQAAAMIGRTALGRLLAGYRGKPPVDRQAVIEAIVALAQLALDNPTIQEIEINPLMVGISGAYAVDARVRVS